MRIKGKTGFPLSEETKTKIGNANRRPIYFNCDYCNEKYVTKQSAYLKKKKHFCSTGCYSLYRKEIMKPEEHNNWRGGISPNEARKRWIIRHREQYAFLRHKEYLRHKGIEGSHTFEEWQRLEEKFQYKCAKCHEAKALTKDHIIPLSLGGTDFIWNIQPLCRSCNSKKWKKLENPELLKEDK